MTRKIFIAQVIIFAILVSSFFLPFPIRREVFPFVAMLAFLFFILGVFLIVRTRKEETKNPLKKYLMLVGISSSGFLASVLLHNFFYALGILAENVSFLRLFFELLHVAFFIAGIIGCPLGFLIGALGAARILIRNQD